MGLEAAVSHFLSTLKENNKFYNNEQQWRTHFLFRWSEMFHKKQKMWTFSHSKCSGWWKSTKGKVRDEGGKPGWCVRSDTVVLQEAEEGVLRWAQLVHRILQASSVHAWLERLDDFTISLTFSQVGAQREDLAHTRAHRQASLCIIPWGEGDLTFPSRRMTSFDLSSTHFLTKTHIIDSGLVFN